MWYVKIKYCYFENIYIYCSINVKYLFCWFLEKYINKKNLILSRLKLFKLLVLNF